MNWRKKNKINKYFHCVLVVCSTENLSAISGLSWLPGQTHSRMSTLCDSSNELHLMKYWTITFWNLCHLAICITEAELFVSDKDTCRWSTRLIGTNCLTADYMHATTDCTMAEGCVFIEKESRNIRPNPAIYAAVLCKRNPSLCQGSSPFHCSRYSLQMVIDSAPSLSFLGLKKEKKERSWNGCTDVVGGGSASARRTWVSRHALIAVTYCWHGAVSKLFCFKHVINDNISTKHGSCFLPSISFGFTRIISGRFFFPMADELGLHSLPCCQVLRGAYCSTASGLWCTMYNQSIFQGNFNSKEGIHELTLFHVQSTNGKTISEFENFGNNTLIICHLLGNALTWNLPQA